MQNTVSSQKNMNGLNSFSFAVFIVIFSVILVLFTIVLFINIFNQLLLFLYFYSALILVISCALVIFSSFL